MRFTFILFLFSVVSAFSQDDFFLDKRNFYDFGKKFHAEIHYLPSVNKDSTTAIILYRYSYDLVMFQKFGINSSNSETFYCIPKIEIEFEDNDGIIRSRIIKQDTIFEENYEKTISKTDFLFGSDRIKLLNGNYKVTFRIGDQTKSNIKRLDINDSVNCNFSNSEVIGNPIFVQIDNDNSLHPFIIRNNIKFSSKPVKMIIPVSFKDEFTKYHYSVKFWRGKKSGLSWTSDFSKSEYVIPLKNSTINIANSVKNNVELKYESFTSSESQIFQGLVEIDLPIEDIVPGSYSFVFVKDGTKDSIKSTFEVVWEDMPFILQRPRIAIESMYYILTDEEYKQMAGADNDEYSNEILKYWAKQDPTKYTPFNESMFEYFKRVDYTFFNYRTLSEKNGIKTDRGKIHILYGKPNNIDRQLSDDKTLEFWIYDHLKKKFIFEAKSNAIYKLIEIKDL